MFEKKREIKLNHLNKQHPAGSEFLKEDEGNLDNLSEEELNARGGGGDEISISAMASRLAIARSNWLLPAPEAPTTATCSPGRSSKLKLRYNN